MLRNIFKITIRGLWKNKGFSAINIAGLSIAFTCFTIILLYVNNELSFDRYHKNADHIYRIAKDFVNDDGTKIPDATTPPALVPALRKGLPEVAFATRLFPSRGRKYLIQYRDKGFYETDLLRVDSSFFDVFDFPLVRGNKKTVFKEIQSILLTQMAAKKYFGNEDPIGKILRININNGQHYVVSGVLKDVPQNSHFTFNFLIPFTATGRNTDKDWDWYSFYTYVLLKPNASRDAFDNKLQPLFKKYQPESKNRYYSQPITDIHLKSRLKSELGTNGDLFYIKILITIAVFIILLAGINYVNLITAQSAKRAKEVGVRKVAGASQLLLVKQFLMESVCTAFVSFFICLFAVSFLLPFASQLLNTRLLLFSRDQLSLWISLVIITLVVGILAGLYPAFYLSAFQPIKVLKGKFLSSYHGAYLRKSLIVFQLAISIVLIIGFIVIYQQVDFVTKKNLGFDKNNILLLSNIRGNGIRSAGDPGAMVEELRRDPAVINLARADGILGGLSSTNGVSTKDKNDHIELNFIRVDHTFLPTLNIQLKEGRNFLNQSRADSTSIILNEKAVEQLGLKKPFLGQQLAWDDEAGKAHPVTVVGITKNFHFTSLHEPIKPFAFVSEENNGSTFFLKLHSQDLAKEIAAIKKVWEKYNPDKPFEYTFQDEQIAKLYQTDLKFESLFSGLTVLAVLIACLGLLGLSIFIADTRTKEIGIRKVLGASVPGIITMLSADFVKLIFLAVVFAFPIAWWAMHSWLQNYAYRIEISWWIFIAAGALALLVALITISFHAIKAAIANPVKSLRTE